jgi:hypothetical protein
MRRLLLAAGVAAALAGPAGAEVSDTGVFGYWTTFAGVATDGKPVCGMRTDWRAGGTFLIKYFGQDELVVQIGREGWQVPFGQPVTVLIRVDQAPAFSIVSHGVGDVGRGWSVLELWAATGKSAIEEFVALLTTGRQVSVSFPDGDEPPWIGQLDGSGAALRSFTACGTTIDAANSRAPGTTQPFSRREAPEPPPAGTITQPFHRL